MKRQVRDMRVEARFRQRAELELAPSRSWKKVYMKKESQSSVGSLKASSVRGLSASPAWRASSSSGLLAPVAAEESMQQVDHRPEVPAFLDVDLVEVAQVVERGRG